MSTPATTEGFAPLDVPDAGKPCQTYYKIVGDLGSGEVPIVVLNGGPGSSHEYMLSFADLAPRAPVIFYDQVGSGRATHLPEKIGHTQFWTVQLFVDEFHNLLKHLKVETYDVVGHSWGAMLAMEIAVRQPQGLRKLVVASGPASIGLWVETAKKWLTTLPQDIQDKIEKHESAGTFDSPEYQEAIGYYNKQFTLRLDTWPEEVIKSFHGVEEDPTVYGTMQGPSEFTVIGSLKTWDIRPQLHKINVPTLLTNGVYDGASDAAVTPVFQAVSKVKWVTFSKSSHMAHWEERERYMQIVGDFLQAP
ncbi:hypothetical protein FOMPIDRAFT_1032930 [Fomitopsis schrenkii]|uniref:AB hydrolase-1 domain-containing protein n=1 Tax=Fomitopsis schrenkii TaxID=2126942 RepID=S8DPU8_FOMSC|nr:hypothetical protein FOMPIDRAFT_1032930 [Fomitopsis schrenkii]